MSGSARAIDMVPETETTGVVRRAIRKEFGTFISDYSTVCAYSSHSRSLPHGPLNVFRSGHVSGNIFR
jgi:hypothetical protein